MENTKHTKGEWKIYRVFEAPLNTVHDDGGEAEHLDHWITCNNKIIGDVKMVNFTKGEIQGFDYVNNLEEMEANANLIISAPLLLEQVAKLQSDKETLLEALKITTELAEWSEKYPRGRTYPMSKITMDDELIAIEEKAKKFVSDATKEIVIDSKINKSVLFVNWLMENCELAKDNSLWSYSGEDYTNEKLFDVFTEATNP